MFGIPCNRNWHFHYQRDSTQYKEIIRLSFFFLYLDPFICLLVSHHLKYKFIPLTLKRLLLLSRRKQKVGITFLTRYPLVCLRHRRDRLHSIDPLIGIRRTRLERRHDTHVETPTVTNDIELSWSQSYVLRITLSIYKVICLCCLTPSVFPHFVSSICLWFSMLQNAPYRWTTVLQLAILWGGKRLAFCLFPQLLCVHIFCMDAEVCHAIIPSFSACFFPLWLSTFFFM